MMILYELLPRSIAASVEPGHLLVSLHSDFTLVMVSKHPSDPESGYGILS